MEFRLQQVVATGCTDALVAFRLHLPTPVWEVISIQKTVLVDKAELTLGSALLQGRLRACYLLAGAPQSSPPFPPLGSPLPLGSTTTWTAPAESLWAEQPFGLRIALAEAEPGLDLALLSAHVESQSVQPAGTDSLGRLLALDDQSVLHLAVRLTRWVTTGPVPEPMGHGTASREPDPPALPHHTPPTRPFLARFRSS